jgi:formate hydrogenlyase subunit 3/multisubunit Na+/H+ antiporter MnhD subunit
VTILPFLVIAFGAGAASLLARQSERLSAVIGVLGLLAAVIAASGIRPGESLAVGGGELVGSAYLRLFVLLGSIVGLGLTLLGLVTSTHRHAPGVLLGGIGAAGLALALPDARIAVIAATAGGLLGILVTVVTPPTARAVVVGGRELRALAIAGVLAVLAAGWIARPLGQLAAEPAVFGLAYLGFAVAVAIRFGAIPFHFWAARLADAAPEVTLPMLMAWSPGAFAVVALAWADQSVAPLLLPLGLERALVVAVGAVSVVLGTVAAMIQDDLEHVVGYTIIADAGIAILGLAALDPAAWEPARTWVIVFVVIRSAFAAWAVALRGAYGTRKIGDLSGWAMRSPLLALSFGLIVLASIGWPGFVAWQARAALIDLTLDGLLVVLVTAGALAQIAVYARLVMVGVGPPSAKVAAGPGERPRRPEPVPARPFVGRAGAGPTVQRAGYALNEAIEAARVVPAAIRVNRALVAGLLVLGLSGIAFGVAAGGFGVSEAAAAVPGQDSGPSVPPAEGPTESGEPSPAPTEPVSEPPSPSASPAPSVFPSLGPSASAAPSGS